MKTVTEEDDVDSTPGNLNLHPEGPFEDDEDSDGLFDPNALADLGITKTDDIDPIAVGGTLTYTVTVTNNGPSAGVGVVVTDTLPSEVTFVSSTDSCVEGPTDTLTCTLGLIPPSAPNNVVSFDIVVTVDALPPSGTITNTATVSSDSPDSNPDNDTDSEDTIVQDPSILLTKSGTLNDDDGTPGVSPGDSIDYTFEVENTGNVTLTNVTLADTVGGVTLFGGPIASLAPGATDTTTFTGSYDITQADIDAGLKDNTATVTGTPPIGSDVSDDDDHTESLAQTPGIAIVKLANKASVSSAGEVITYTYTVTNTGNVSLTNVTLSDDNTDATPTFTGGDTDSDSELDLTETWTYTAVHTVTQAEMDAGSDIVNIGTVDSTEAGPETDTETVTITQTPGIAIVKLANKASVSSTGEVITYTYTVTNTGNVSLTNVTLSDDNTDATPTFTGGDTDSDSELDLTETWTYTAVHTVTQAEMDAGSDIVNIGTVDSTEAGPETDTETVTITQTPGYTISKTVFDVAGDGPAGEADEAGDVITYEIMVTNTGNLSINGVVLADPLLEGAFGTLGAAVESLNPDGILDVPGETFTYTGIYTVQQSDIDNFGIDKDGLPDGNGFIDNTASVTSIEIPAAQESSAAVPVILPPASCELEISKSCCVLPPPSANGGTDCEGKVVEAIFMYTGDDCSATTNDQKGKLSCIGVIGGDPNINLFDPLFPNQFLEPVDVVLKGKGADKINISTEFGGTSLVVGERIAFSHVDSGKTLGSNTQFDLEGFYGTQSLKIHTSCSKPLNVGDQLGSMLLVQLTSTEGGTVTLPDGNELTACDSRLTEVVFEYTANGCEDPLANGQGGKASCEDFFTPLPDLADMTLVYTGKDPEKFTITQDDPNQPIFKLITTRKELHSDTKLEIRDSTGTVLLQKLKMHSSCSQPLSLGDVFGSLRVVEFSTKDGGQFLLPDPEPPAPTNLCTIELAPPGPHCTTKPTSLTFRFVAGDCSITNDQEGRASCIQHGDPLLETEIARIVVTGTKKNADRIYSDTADVAVGDIVTALASAGGSSKFGSSTMAKIYVNGLLRQEIEFHTSCSKELNLGDRFGGLEVFGMDRQEGGPISLGAMI